MSDSAARASSLQFTRSSAATVTPTASSLRFIMSPTSDSSFLFFLCTSFLPSFLVTPSSRIPPVLPPAPAASRPLLLQPETATERAFRTPSKPSGQRRSSRMSSQSLILTSLLWSLAILSVVEAQLEPCTATHPFVGFRGTFTPDLGTIQILDDCRFSHETRVGFNNVSIRGLRWGGQIQDSQGNVQRVGVISSSVVSGSDLPVAYRLLPGLGWSSIDFLTIQSTAGEIVAAVPLSRPTVITTTTTTTRTTTTSIMMTTTTAPASATVPAPTTTAPPTGTALPLNTAVPTITDPASPIVVRIGPNPNYPGLLPTVLNVSLWINDTESPVLLMTRGKRYTFSIQAGTAHPVYITTSREGGKRNVANSTEIIVAGNLTTFGTISNPLLLDFVAPLKSEVGGINETTALFYQCYIHRRMGWKIIFQDIPSADAGTSGANVATRSAGGIALVVLVVVTTALML